MNCETVNDYIMKYFDGNINDIEKLHLKQHIKGCKKCKDEFESLSEIFGFLENENEVEPPDDFEACVMEKVENYEISRRKNVDNFLIMIYGTTSVLLGALTILLIYKLNVIGVFSEILKAGSIEDVFWNVVIYLYEFFIFIYNILKVVYLEFGNYSALVAAPVMFLVYQKVMKKPYEENVNDVKTE